MHDKIAATWEQASPKLNKVCKHYNIHYITYPAIQVQCAATTSPLLFMITHGSKNPAVIHCERLTYEALLKYIKLRNALPTFPITTNVSPSETE